MSEFDPRLIVWKGGIVPAFSAAVRYLLVPFILFYILARVFNGFDRPDWSDIFDDLQTIVLLFSMPLIVLAFLRGLYPRGSYSRFTFAVIALPVVVFMAYSMLLGGRIQDLLAQDGLDMDLMLLFYFAFIGAVLGLLVHLGDFIDERYNFLVLRSRLLATPAPPARVARDPAKHRTWHDFLPRYGRYRPGFKESKGAFTRFIVWPTIIFLAAAAILVKVNDSLPVDFDLALKDTASLLIVIGVPLAALAFFKGFYPKGSVSRFAFFAAMALLTCLWIWYAALGGVASVDMTGMASVKVDYSLFILLFILAAALWALYALVEMISYRPDWRRNGFYPVEDAKIKEQKDLDKARKRMEKQKKAEEKRQGKV
ncbi:MAG: hypothetical protein A4E32_01211 [Methanomassiliicoccales archaeon PtaU1.Bin124]|nr:MAG: hypothetical protein A4E32_01211 [Methanomassiliicoccales archaeon PtaU1.Bin124]